MITYEDTPNGIKVKLEGKVVGKIRLIAVGNEPAQYQYQPAGSRNAGDVYPTLAACIASLEDDGVMTEYNKAQKMHQAFSTLVNEFAREGKTAMAEQVTKIALEVPDDSMARLYDILQASFRKDVA